MIDRWTDILYFVPRLQKIFRFRYVMLYRLLRELWDWFTSLLFAGIWLLSVTGEVCQQSLM
jgi:hypothetical protein